LAKERVQVDIVTNVGEAVKGFATLVAGLHVAHKAFGMLKEAALNTLKIHAEFEQLETSLRVLTGSAAQAKLVFTELKQFAASTPFALNDLATGAKNLIAFGINAEDVTDKMRNLGNASGGNVQRAFRSWRHCAISSA
jgi:phage tail tape-measure protein